MSILNRPVSVGVSEVTVMYLSSTLNSVYFVGFEIFTALCCNTV
jgi:hypothetical protein